MDINMSRNLESELVTLIENDKWMMDILKTVRSLNLNDCWIGAGFVRNKVWDEKHKKSRTKLNDIDVIHFDKSNTTEAHDIQIELKLTKVNPTVNWSVKNQSRMHIRNGHNEYVDCNDAISYWPETATAVAIRINDKNQIECIAPYGLNDLFDLTVTPTPNFDLITYMERIKQKKWKETWHKLEIKE